MDTSKTKQLNWRNKRTIDTVDKNAKIILSDDTYVDFSEIGKAGLTPEEKAAVDSGITAEKVADYDAHIQNKDAHVTSEEKQAWDDKYNKPDSGIPMSDLSQQVVDTMTSIYVEQAEALYIDGDRPNNN